MRSEGVRGSRICHNVSAIGTLAGAVFRRWWVQLCKRQTKGRIRLLSYVQDRLYRSRVVSADVTDRGIIVTFADGKCALYTSSFLHGETGSHAAMIVPLDEAENGIL